MFIIVGVAAKDFDILKGSNDSVWKLNSRAGEIMELSVEMIEMIRFFPPSKPTTLTGVISECQQR